MLYVQAFSGALMLVGTVIAAVVVVATFIKTSKEQARSSNDTWSAAVDALKEHNDALKGLMQDMDARQLRKETEAIELRAFIATKELEIARLERAEVQWTRRNDYLYSMVMDYRDRLQKHGEDVPIPNGGALR